MILSASISIAALQGVSASVAAVVIVSASAGEPEGS
jgi:hypothetical protein